MHETVETRVIRIEEGMVSMHGKMDGVFTKINDVHVDLKDLSKDHHGTNNRVSILERDRFWLFTLAGSAFTVGIAALAAVLKK
jgi:hypothetical protein